MADKLTQSGMTCEIKVAPQMWHVWPMAVDLPESVTAFQIVADFIERCCQGR